MLTLLVGGARSGKSALAVDWGRRHEAAGGSVVFVATATALDDDMNLRITRHRAERPGWPTVEAPHDIGTVIDDHRDGLLIVDCLTLWVSNLLLRGDADDDIVSTATDIARRCADRTAPVVAISNEVGMGIHPESELGRRYRDVLGRVNQVWAGAAHQTLLLVAGRVLRLDDPKDYSP